MAARFFEERTDQSEVKARIVQKYFYAWAKVVGSAVKMNGKKLAYIDLYAGPGRYRDGSASTPLLVLENAIEDADLSKMLVALFNDANKDLTNTLQNEIDALPGIETLTYRPSVMCGEIGEDAAKFFSSTRLILHIR